MARRYDRLKIVKTGGEFWVTDNSEQLELKYSQLNFEKP